MFAPGFNQSPDQYSALLDHVATAGYIVAAVEFPGTTSAITAPPDAADIEQQPADVSFAITQLLQQSPDPGSAPIDPARIAIMGHSDGGLTATAIAYNQSYRDPRIRAAVVMSGGTIKFPGNLFPPESPPVLAIHGTADTTNPFTASIAVFDGIPPPTDRFLVSVIGGTHLGPFTTDPVVTTVAQTIIDFLNLEIRSDPQARNRLTVDANQPSQLALRTN